jgi:hypothetical protein
VEKRYVSLTTKGKAMIERMLELHHNGATEAEAYAQATREFGVPGDDDEPPEEAA